MKKSWLIIALLFLFGCKKDKPKESLFNRYLASVESVGLPVSFYSQDEFSSISDSYLEPGFKTYKHIWATEPYGKVYESDEFIAMIEIVPSDVIVPLIMTYSRNGEKIDSLNIYQGGGMDMGYRATVLATLKPDFSISITDSIRRWEFNKKGDDIIRNSDKLTLNKSRYIIDEKGRFVKQ